MGGGGGRPRLAVLRVRVRLPAQPRLLDPAAPAAISSGAQGRTGWTARQAKPAAAKGQQTRTPDKRRAVERRPAAARAGPAGPANALPASAFEWVVVRNCDPTARPQSVRQALNAVVRPSTLVPGGPFPVEVLSLTATSFLVLAPAASVHQLVDVLLTLTSRDAALPLWSGATRAPAVMERLAADGSWLAGVHPDQRRLLVSSVPKLQSRIALLEARRYPSKQAVLSRLGRLLAALQATDNSSGADRAESAAAGLMLVHVPRASAVAMEAEPQGVAQAETRKHAAPELAAPARVDAEPENAELATPIRAAAEPANPGLEAPVRAAAEPENAGHGLAEQETPEHAAWEHVAPEETAAMGTGDGPSAAGAGAGASHLQPAMPVVEQVHGTLRANTDPKRAAALPLSQSQSPTAAVRAPKRVCTVTEHSGSEDESEEDVPLSQPSQGFTCPVAACSHTCFDAKQFGWHLRTAHSQQEQAAVPAHCYADCGLGVYSCGRPRPPTVTSQVASNHRRRCDLCMGLTGAPASQAEPDTAAATAAESVLPQGGAAAQDGTLDQPRAGGVGSLQGQAVSMRRVTRSQTQARQAVSEPGLVADPAARAKQTRTGQPMCRWTGSRAE
ncbi:hypothetical protein FVE85_0003 [Porphyridium purpureum]|uniref:C2H2-type domain-containing protein n=1 Tax=Porphyridium purpureum TaxID=35688 RepID=A0A5J4YZX1_PORPP|nr:hypothetical protein FVE85_0003 [Porphyridium purpureum]|eukprot:POR7333..scf208_2